MSDVVNETKKMGLFQRGVLQNPITLKELRSRMRGRRAFAILSFYLLATCVIIFFTYFFLVRDSLTSSSNGQAAGQVIFFFLISIQIFLVIFVAPAFTAGAITGEKERQTFELLRTTLMSPRRFVLGKMISALGYVMLLIISTIPLISLAFMIGGISWVEIVVSQTMLIAGAFTYSLMGLYFSSRMKTTLAATVTTYIITLVVLIGLPLVISFASLMIGPFLVLSNYPDWFDIVIGYGLVLIGFTNLPGAMVAAEAFLLEQNGVWGFWASGTSRYYIISPWYGALITHLVVAWLFFRWTVKRVAKISE